MSSRSKKTMTSWLRRPFDDSGYPKMHFIERSYSHDQTNWWIPNRACTEAMLRSSGFAIESQPEEEGVCLPVEACRSACRWASLRLPCGRRNTLSAGLIDQAEELLQRRLVARAEEAFKRSLRNGDDAGRCHGGLWTAAMLAGDFEEAWTQSDAIRELGSVDPHRFWNGEALEGKRADRTVSAWLWGCGADAPVCSNVGEGLCLCRVRGALLGFCRSPPILQAWGLVSRGDRMHP